MRFKVKLSLGATLLWLLAAFIASSAVLYGVARLVACAIKG
jgi:hypothetical protein